LFDSFETVDWDTACEFCLAPRAIRLAYFRGRNPSQEAGARVARSLEAVRALRFGQLFSSWSHRPASKPISRRWPSRSRRVRVSPRAPRLSSSTTTSTWTFQHCATQRSLRLEGVNQSGTLQPDVRRGGHAADVGCR